MNTFLQNIVATTVLVLTSAGGVACANDTLHIECEIKRPITFGGMNWESNLIITEIESFIIEKGYGCKVETTPVETLPALAALERGDIDINAEVWSNSIAVPWDLAEKTGKVKRVGQLYTGGEGWFIPRYTAERLPELRSVSDLSSFKDAFADPEEPGKGRFYSCPAGWGCEVSNSHLFNVLTLENSFSNYFPGNGAAQKAAIVSNYKKKHNLVFYYWYPTLLVSTLDLVELGLPPNNSAQDREMVSSKDAPLPTWNSTTVVFTAVNSNFSKKAPKITEFISKVSIPLSVVNETLAYMETTSSDITQVARWFLKNKTRIWAEWVPSDIANRVRLAL